VVILRRGLWGAVERSEGYRQYSMKQLLLFRQSKASNRRKIRTNKRERGEGRKEIRNPKLTFERGLPHNMLFGGEKSGDKVRYQYRECATVKMREPIRNDDWKWRISFYPTGITSVQRLRLIDIVEFCTSAAELRND
jgi:hypothetical protein